jgi:hypothetical protein
MENLNQLIFNNDTFLPFIKCYNDTNFQDWWKNRLIGKMCDKFFMKNIDEISKNIFHTNQEVHMVFQRC